MRFTCLPARGAAHTFSVAVVDEDSQQLEARWSPAPKCGEHSDSKVIRFGTYGKTTAKPRQRYKCFPDDGSKPHVFTPSLPRDHVHDGEEHCEHCEELRGVHRGDTAVARRHSWSTRIVARGLEQLASGGTYADVSRWALRVSGVKRTRKSTSAEGADDDMAVSPVDGSADGSVKRRRKSSRASKEARNAWHIAADWVEAFSPVIYEPVEADLRARAAAERERLDALIRKRQALVRPQVILVDDVPVYGRDLDGRKRSRRDAGYFVLVLAELLWPDATAEADEPFVRPPEPVVRLRLVRAMAKSNTAAWRVLFDELGYRPDFVVADAGTGIAAAVRSHFDPKRTKFIPSLWHVAQKVELALADTPGAMTVSAAGKQLIEPLHIHVRKLSRSSGVLDSAATWTAWWDELLAILKTHRLAADEVRNKRKTYEPAFKEVLPAIAKQPQIPVSTGGLETLIAKHVKPLLAMRRTSFGNIERTNLLLDLVVARHHGAFDNLNDVAKLLRGDTEPNGGYTIALRTIADPRPIGGTYSSLRDATLLATVAKQRGLT